MDCSLSGFSTHGILQARILEWVTISFSRGSVWPRDWTQVSCIGRQILYHWATWEIQLVMQIEITRSEHLRSVHMAKMKKDWQMKCWWKCGATGTFVRCLYELPTAAQQYDHKYSSWQWHMLTSHSFSRIEVYLRLGWVLCKVPIKMPTGLWSHMRLEQGRICVQAHLLAGNEEHSVLHGCLNRGSHFLLPVDLKLPVR